MEERQFPVLLTWREQKNHPELRQSIPWAMIAPHEGQAKRNHDQSLETLARRGGLGYSEMVAVLEGMHWREVREMPEIEARERINLLVAEWEASK